MRKYIEFEIAKKYLHEACAFIGGNGGMMLKIKFDEEPTIELPPTDIEKLPSAQSEQQWIPCSERLPEKDGRYWISTKTIACEDNFENGEFVFYRSNVLAWMPLPEPWKGETDEQIH